MSHFESVNTRAEMLLRSSEACGLGIAQDCKTVASGVMDCLELVWSPRAVDDGGSNGLLFICSGSSVPKRRTEACSVASVKGEGGGVGYICVGNNNISSGQS